MKARASVMAAIIAMIGSAFAATAYAGDADTLYLRNDGIPMASMQERPPKTGKLTNFDPGRDISPGLFLERTPNGIQETDDAKFQHWQTDVGSLTLSGIPTLVLWASLEDYDRTKVGVFTAYLLDCPAWGYDCTALSAVKHRFQLGPINAWVETQVTFGEVDYEIAEDRALGIRVVVSDQSADDLLFAYDRMNYRSRLVFTSAPLVAAVTGEVQDVAPIEEPTPALAAAVAEEPVANVVEPLVGTPSDQGLSPVWEWLISVCVSALMLATLAAFLLESLSRRGSHAARGRRWGWLFSARAR